MVEANSAYPDLGSDASSVWNSVLLSFFSHHFAGSQVVATRNVGFISQAGVSVTFFGEIAQTRGLLRHETVEPPLNGYMFPCFKASLQRPDHPSTVTFVSSQGSHIGPRGSAVGLYIFLLLNFGKLQFIQVQMNGNMTKIIPPGVLCRCTGVVTSKAASKYEYN